MPNDKQNEQSQYNNPNKPSKTSDKMKNDPQRREGQRDDKSSQND